MADSTKKDRHNTSRDVINALKMSQRLTAAVDAWAKAHDTVRSDAICQLVELGLNSTPSADSLGGA